MPVEAHEGRMPFEGGHTWFRITGTLASAPAPLIVLHGGPGAAHDYLDRFSLLAETGHAVIHYDQFGCGRSTHRPDKGADYWTVQLFLDEHLCRVTPWPEEVRRSFDAIAAEPTVYHTMNGPSEFYVPGTIRDWTIEDRLPRIRAATLVISGRHDEATDACVRPYAVRIPGARRVVFEHSSHVPHVEETDLAMAIIGAFLVDHD
jgi:pimeloyl-ACP methyl ester carboxylesterase